MNARTLLTCSLLAATSLAQTVVIPNGTAAAEGPSSTAYAFGRGSSQVRVQYLYDSSHFTNQGVLTPVVVTQLRFRANGGAVNVGATYTNATVQMSTAAVDYTAPSATFANNHGANLTTVHAGPVTVASGGGTTPNNWYVDLPITPFFYDPNAGDLCLDLAHDGVGPSVAGPAHDAVTTGSLTSRVSNLTNYLSPTGTTQQNVGIVVELTCAPPTGLFASFTASTQTGGTPLLVSFTDQSFTSAPGGVTSWAWDFDGDNVVDSTAQNPTFTYTVCGTYDVKLTVGDGVNPPSTLTRPAYIVTDEVTPAFTSSLIAPNTLLFIDQSTPTPTSWAWDLDGDSVIDSTSPTAVFVYPTGCVPIDVTLTVSRLCRGPYTLTRRVRVSDSLATREDGNTSFGAGGGNFFDVDVLNPNGISVCAIDTKTTAAANAAVTVNVYATPGTYVGVQQNAAAWRLIATGTATGTGSLQPPVPVTLAQPFYLAPGSHGLFVQVSGGGGPQYTSGANAYGNADLTLTLGASQATPFVSAPATPRTWNGALHYSTCATGGEAGFGFFGLGCAGTLPVSRQIASSLPRLGQSLVVGVDNLPVSVAVMIVGLSRTVSAFGPLPLDVAPIGMPGCSARVSLDGAEVMLGASNAATWTFAIPNTPALACMQFFTQALVFDAPANPFGAVLSDAAAAVIGN